MNDNNWKLMGRQQVLEGLRYLEKLNPTSDSTGKGALLIYQGAQFMFGIDTSAYLKKHFKVSGSYSEIADKLGDMYPNKKWQMIIWDFLQDHDPHFTELQEKVAQKKQHDREEERHSEIHQAFMIRYPHLETLKADIQTPLIKAGKSFGMQKSSKVSPIHSVEVSTSNDKMDVFIADVKINQPKQVASKQNPYGTYTVILNMKTSQFTFTDNGTIKANHARIEKEKNPKDSFHLSGKFKNLVNLQPFFAQYLYLCHRKYQKYRME